MKETWKVRESREPRETVDAKLFFTSSRSCRTKTAHIAYPFHDVYADDNRVTDIDDVYLGGDGSIQLLVAWKPSLIALDSLVGRELRRRCEQFFEMR